MQVSAASESAAHLPWLWPDSQSLTVLGQPLSPATWPALRRDPAALLLVLRQPSSAHLPHKHAAIEPARFLEPRVLETALHWFEHDCGSWIDWRQPAVLPVYEAALAIAHYARFLAQQSRVCDPAAAWAAGLLAPLGWFAIAAQNPALVASCRSDPHFAANPLEVQRRHWGLDHAAIARRLARRWQLPDWLRFVIGHDDLSIDAVELLGTDTALYATVQLARFLADQSGFSLGLAGAADLESLLSWLQLRSEDVDVVQSRFQAVDFSEAFEPEWRDPRSRGEQPARLRMALEHRRMEAAPYVQLLERDLDRMHQALIRVGAADEERLRDAKLEALAEFAAGASHEINNPLAVIAGQSQYLLHGGPDDRHRKALESIVRQTQRIHGILAELMQFARPPQLHPQRLSLTETIQKTVNQYVGHALEAGVVLEWAATDDPIWLDGDARQLQTALGCLVRNAIEAAAPQKGCVRIGIELVGRHAEVCVEDTGPGLNHEQREHMFDPFYCGRSAGRGRGLGLPTAWRLAREHGGDVRYVPIPGGPTQFVLTLPMPECSERLSA